METNSQIKKFDAARQMIWSEVYVPMVPDSQGDYMTAAQIEQTAHNFMRGQRVYNVDTEHSLQKNDSCVIESFIARPGDVDFIPGSWVVGIHVVNPVTWAAIEKGEINGLSMYGSGSRNNQVLELEIPDDGVVKGETHDQAGHKHQFYLQFDEKGKVVKGHTDAVTIGGVAHSHVIKGGTITESAEGHSHRYSVSDALAKLQTLIQKDGGGNPNHDEKGRFASGSGGEYTRAQYEADKAAGKNPNPNKVTNWSNVHVSLNGTKIGILKPNPINGSWKSFHETMGYTGKPTDSLAHAASNLLVAHDTAAQQQWNSDYNNQYGVRDMALDFDEG